MIMITIISLVGLSSCNTEQFGPLIDHLQDTQNRGESAVLSRRQHQIQNRAKITPSEEALFTAEYLAGKSTKQIARESGRSRAAVSSAIKRSGVTIRSSRSSTKEDVQEMVALQASGMSLVKIADRLGFSEKTVWTQLRNAAAR